VKDPIVLSLLQRLLPENSNIEDLSKITNVFDLQTLLMRPVFERHIFPTFDELTATGHQKLDPKKAYLFISNHRDIVLDSYILNYFLFIEGFKSAEIAIGDNLLKDAWIKDLVRLNKCFIVKRNLDNAEMLAASKKLSAYIHHTIHSRKESVWIAQRAGRAKDGNDETNRGLINMLGMSSANGLVTHFKQLNIVPVSISYEFDPCDARKTKELYVESQGKEYLKSEKEDVESMQIGIVEPKGKGHVHFGSPIDVELDAISGEDRKEVISVLVENIDYQIQKNYRLWPSNLIANELLGFESKKEPDFEKDKEIFVTRMNTMLKGVEGDSDELRKIFLAIYQQPLLNKAKHG
jgi:1-acyl-sn-glycerol-3-phosphate acyltransferase